MRIFILGLILIFLQSMTIARPPAGETVEVKVGTQGKASKSGLKIEFVELLDDSRCPKGTTCIWAGEGRIRIRVKKTGQKPQTFELATTEGRNKVNVAGYELRLAGLKPQPAVNVRIDRTKYIAMLIIGKS